MNTTIKTVGVTVASAFAAAGVFVGAQGVFGLGQLPSTVSKLGQNPTTVTLVASAPDELSSVVTTRDWTEVDTSGSRVRPRGANPTPPPSAPIVAASSPRGSAAQVADTSAPVTATAAPSAPAPVQIAVAVAATIQQVDYLAALNAAANEPTENVVQKPKTKSSKKSPRQ